MPDIHTIHLRHPWRCEPCGGGTLWSRNFNWPAGLTPRETARLVVEGVPGSAVVRLSGKPLLASPGGVFDVTELLATSNKLTIELVDSFPASEIECPLDVRLEIVEG